MKMNATTVVKIFETYAKTAMSIKEVSDKFGIKVSEFYQLRDEAVIKAWIPLKTVEQMREKARCNQKKNGDGRKVTSSDAHYNELLKKRQAYYLNKLEERKMELEFQISEFENFSNFEDEEYSKLSVLRQRLNLLNRQINQFKGGMVF